MVHYKGGTMKSITIHNLDTKLEQLIQKKAKSQQLSLNKTIQLLLRESFGLTDKKAKTHKEDFADLYGVWSKQEADEFDKATQDFYLVHKKDWV